MTASTTPMSIVPTPPAALAVASTTVEVPSLGTITVIDGATLERAHEIRGQIARLGTVTEANYVEADAVVGRAAVHNRDVEVRRVMLGAPFLSAGRFINDAARDASLKAEAKTLTDSVAAVRRAVEQRQRAQAAERARAAAEAEAALARARAQAEESARALAEIEASSSPADAEALIELRAEAEEVEHEARTVAMDLGGKAWLAAAEAGSAPMPRISTGTRKVKRLIIDDESKIPHMVNGLKCTAAVTSTITTLLKGGIEVPGCRWAEVDETTAGRR